MRSTFVWIAVIVVVALVVFGYPVRGTIRMHVDIPQAGQPEVTREVQIYAAQVDWERELQAAGHGIPTVNVSALFLPLDQGRATGQPEALDYEVEYRGFSGLIDVPRRVQGAVDWVEARLILEARIRSLSRAGERSDRDSLVWEIYGSPFSDLARAALVEEQSRRPDPLIESLLARWPASNR